MALNLILNLTKIFREIFKILELPELFRKNQNFPEFKK